MSFGRHEAPLSLCALQQSYTTSLGESLSHIKVRVAVLRRLPQTANAVLRVDRMRPPRRPTTLPTCLALTTSTGSHRGLLKLGEPLR